MKKIPPLAVFVISVITLTSAMAYQPPQMPIDLFENNLVASDDLPPYFGKDSIPDTQASYLEGWLIASDDLPPYFGKDSIRI